MTQFGLFDLDERLAKLSETVIVEEPVAVVDFEQFFPLLEGRFHERIAAVADDLALIMY